MAAKLFGAGTAAVGRSLKVHGLEFRVVGVFSERVQTFGQSEVSENSVLVPLTVLRYFQEVERVDPLYVSARGQRHVEEVAGLVRETLESRHRPGSLYRVDTLLSILDAVRSILLAMGLEMILVASVTLAVSGIFSMNMMLMTVSEWTVEIGIRKAVGTTRREIRLKFLAEALTLTVLGGLCGAVLGTGLPWVVGQVWTELSVRVPSAWMVFALLVAAGAGAVFGLLPADHASKRDPVEALRHQ